MTPTAPINNVNEKTKLRPGLNLVMAVAAGVAVANIYYNQPMLGIMEKDLPASLTRFVPTATQLGYAAGLFLLVPLGDLIERRRLIVIQFGGLAVALAIAAIAPSAAMVVLASLLVGVLSMRKMIMTWVLAGGGLLAGALLAKSVVAAAAGWVVGLAVAQVTPA